LIESIEHEEWKPVKISNRKKDKRVNLRLTQKDYQQIQIKAMGEGLPYQSLIASIVHKYLLNFKNHIKSKELDRGSTVILFCNSSK
jgi:predicted DNA binding CopG/RHH family protein